MLLMFEWSPSSDVGQSRCYYLMKKRQEYSTWIWTREPFLVLILVILYAFLQIALHVQFVLATYSG